MNVLILHGGWEGHTPDAVADFAESEWLAGARVVRSSSLDALTLENLAQFDLLIIIWTFGELSVEQERALLKAVESGMGFVAWHGSASAFLANRPYKLLLGGQFVAHPGDFDVTYRVELNRQHEMTRDLDDFTLTGEQYYLLIDPAVDVLATTKIDGAQFTWLKGITMPYAWIREWGNGRVFYCVAAHTVDDLKQPTIFELIRRGIAWATRSNRPG